MNHSTESCPVELIKMAQAGDEEATAKLLTQYRPMMERAVSFSFSAAHGMSCSREDLMQEASLAVARAISSYDPDRSVTFGAYARRCVRNRLISIARAAHKTPRVTQERQELPTDTAVLDPERIKRLEFVLTPYEHKVFRLTYDGYKPAEIASLLGRDRKSVYNALCRIRKKAAYPD